MWDMWKDFALARNSCEGVGAVDSGLRKIITNYHCLHFLNTEQFAKVRELTTALA